MRVATVIVIGLMLAACNGTSSRYLAERAPTPTTFDSVPESTPADSVEGQVPSGDADSLGAPEPESNQLPKVGPGPVTNIGSTTTTGALAAQTPAATTTTTVSPVEADPQEVETALAELDALLSSLGSAMSSMEQAFEQGE